MLRLGRFLLLLHPPPPVLPVPSLELGPRTRVPSPCANKLSWEGVAAGRVHSMLHVCPRSPQAGQEKLKTPPRAPKSAMAPRDRSAEALPDDKVLALAYTYLSALSLSLLGSGSIVAVTVLRRRCCCDQLRPLFLLSLADFLAALALLSTVAVRLLPTRLFIKAYPFCPYGLMLGMMFYAVSFLMVVVYAYEVKQAFCGWRGERFSVPQERSRCSKRLQLILPSLLAWLLPCLVFLGLLVTGAMSSTREAAPCPLAAAEPLAGNCSRSLYCSRCLVLIHNTQDVCYKHTDRKDSGREGKIFFLVFVALVGAFCMVVYRRVMRWGHRSGHTRLPPPEMASFAGRSPWGGPRMTCYFQMVFLLCWMPAILLGLLSFTSLQPSSLFPLYVAMALTVSLQGFLNSLVYGWLRGNFREEVTGERLPLWCPPDRKAFYDESLVVASEP